MKANDHVIHQSNKILYKSEWDLATDLIPAQVKPWLLHENQQLLL